MCEMYRGERSVIGPYRAGASSYEPGQLGWLVVRDVTSPLFPLKKFRCVHIRRQASPITEISVTGLEILPYEHSSPVTGIKLERSRLVHLVNEAEISHTNSN